MSCILGVLSGPWAGHCVWRWHVFVSVVTICSIYIGSQVGRPCNILIFMCVLWAILVFCGIRAGYAGSVGGCGLCFVRG